MSLSNVTGPRHLSFSVNDPPSRESPKIVSVVNGHAELYDETGKIRFVYQVQVDLYFGAQKSEMPGDALIKIHFHLLNEKNQIVETFGDIYARRGSGDQVFSVSKESLLNIKRVSVSITG